MNDTTVFLDVPSPSNSYQYLYGDHDQYLDASHSESHSSATSPYDMAFSGDFMGTSTLPSPDSRDADDGSESPEMMAATTAAQPKAVAKRKRENRYKNAPPSVLSRRRAQNRASQRAYRERKDQRIKDLEQMLNDARARNDVLNQAYAELHAEYIKLKTSPASLTDHLLPDHPHHHQQQHHNHHNHHHHISSSSMAGGSSIYSTVAADMAAGFVDTGSMLNAGSDLEAYLYPDIATYSL